MKGITMKFHLQVGGGKNKLRARVDNATTGHDLCQVISSLEQFVAGLKGTLHQVVKDEMPRELLVDADAASAWIDKYRFQDGFKWEEDAD